MFPGSWEPPAQSAAAPCSEPSDPDCPPQPEPGLPPCTPAPRLPRGQDCLPASAQLSGCSRGWGREAPRRVSNTRVRPCFGVLLQWRSWCVWRRLKGRREAAAEETGKVSYVPRGEGGWLGGRRITAPSYLPGPLSSSAPPSSAPPPPRPTATAPLTGF